MCWIAETGRGVYEAETLRELSDSIARRYAEGEDSICNIDEIHWQNAEGRNSTLSPKGLSIFIEDCEELNREMIENFRDEEEHIRLESMR